MSKRGNHCYASESFVLGDQVKCTPTVCTPISDSARALGVFRWQSWISRNTTDNESYRLIDSVLDLHCQVASLIARRIHAPAPRALPWKRPKFTSTFNRVIKNIHLLWMLASSNAIPGSSRRMTRHAYRVHNEIRCLLRDCELLVGVHLDTRLIPAQRRSCSLALDESTN